jgi:general secretion pathway protein F
LLIQMVRVGEETGRLHEGLLESAEMLDVDAQRAIQRGLVVLVPLATILMGALVAGLIGSVLVGILSVNDLAF